MKYREGSRHTLVVKLLDLVSGLAVLALAFLFRWTGAARVFVGDEVRLSSSDAYLHARRILLSVQSYPNVAHHDNYINFPNGVAYNWPPLWDFAIASIAKLVGLGQPSERLILTVAAVFPVAIGLATTMVLGYFAGNLYGREARPPAALTAAAFLPLVRFSSVGDPDHHAGVVFFIALVLAALSWVYAGEDGAAHPRRTARRDLLTIAFVAAALAGGMLTWLGFLLIAGFVWISVLGLEIADDRQHGVATTRIGFAFVIAGVAIVPFLATDKLTVTYLSPFHALLLLAGGASLLGTRFLARHLVGILPLLGAVLLLHLAALVPVSLGSRDLLEQVIGGSLKAFGAYPWSQSTMEWQPLIFTREGPTLRYLASTYGHLIYLVPLALAALAWSHLRGRKPSAAVWLFYGWLLMSGVFAQRAIIHAQLFAPTIPVLLAGATTVVWRSWHPETTIPWQRIAPSAGVLMLGLGLFAIKEPLGAVFSRGFYETASWLRDNTPQTTHRLDPDGVPEYGIVSNWEYGDALVVAARRPVVADGNNETNLGGLVRTQGFFQLTDEAEAVRLMEEQHLRYVVVGAGFVYFDGDLSQAGPSEGEQNGMTPRVLGPGDLSPDLRTRLVFARLYAFTEPGVRPLSRFRLLRAGADFGEPLYVYELVTGARITGRSLPGTAVFATTMLELGPNQRAKVRFVTTAEADGSFVLSVPYPTIASPRRAVVRATDYVITDGVASARVRVDEDDIAEGRELDSGFGGETRR